MGTINIYKGISEEYTTIKGNGKIKDLIQASIHDFNLDNAVYINAGDNVTSDYLVKDDDIVFVRVIPGATTAIVIAAIACVASAVALGAAIYSAVETSKMQEQAEKAQRAAKAMSEKIKQLPFIKGANNRSALGYNIPYAMGSVYNVPYKLSNGFYSISGQNGKNQFWNCNFISAYNNAIVQDVSIGSIKILKPNSSIGIPNKDSVPYLADSGINPYFFDKDCDYYDPSSAVEIKYKDEMSLDGINEKVTASSYQDSLDPQEPITKQLEENTYKVDICIKFDGLRKYSDGWTSKVVNFKIESSNDGGKSWSDKGKLSTGEINSNRTVRFQKTINFTASECVGKSITIRITRTTLKEESNSQESAYLNYINCWQYDNTTSTSSQIVVCRPLEMPWRERTTRIGLRVIANDSTKDSLNEINCNIYGKARIWNGTNWTKEIYPTRNPASWVLAVMTTEIHPHSRYADEEIDLQSLGKLYEKCEQEKFYCDGLITEESKKSEILNNILNECNATMYMDHSTGKWTFAIEEKQNVPIALLNSQCIKNVTVTKSFERKPFAVKNTFTNRNSWMVDTFYQTANGIISSKEAYKSKKIIIENAPKFVTTYDHLYKLTRRQLAKQNLQPREITVSVGREGDYYPLYSKVLLQMKPLKIGLSEGVVHSVVMEGNLLTAVVTSDLCDFTDTTKRYGLIIQAQSDNGRKHIYVEVTGSGKTKTVRLKTPTVCSIVPEYGNSYSFGLLDKNGSFNTVTNPMMIYGTKQTVDGWELTLKDYNDVIFEDGDIPEYKTNVTNHKETGLSLPSVTYKEVMDLIESNNIPGKDAITIYSELPSYVFSADENGVIKETNLDNVIHVQLDGKEMPFRFGDITVPNGFYISTDYHTVKIRGNVGGNMNEEGIIRIPVLYHPIKESVKIGFDNTVISNGVTALGFYELDKKETAYNLNFSYAKSTKGQIGAKGDKGDSGKGVKVITDYYLASSENKGIKAEDITSTDIPTLTETLKYLWKTEQITYTDGTSDPKTTPVIIGVYGDKGVGIDFIQNFYLASSVDKGIEIKDITETTPPVIDAVKKYLWNYEHIVYTNKKSEDTKPTIIGVYGDKGDKGENGAKGAKGDTGDKGEKGDTGESTWFAEFDKNNYCFAVNSKGIAWGERLRAKITLQKGEHSVPFTIVSVENNSNEISAKIDCDTIIFESVAGKKISESGTIPVTVQYKNYQEVNIGTNSFCIGIDGKEIGFRIYNSSSKDFVLNFYYSTVKTGINRGLKTSIDSFLLPSEKRYNGDFFTWGGETTSVVYDGVTYTFFKGRVYAWNGCQWEESFDDGQLGESFNNVMAVLDDEVVNNNSKLEMTMRKLSSVTIFCEELAAQVAFIKKLCTQDIVLAKGGKIRSEVDTVNKGLLLTADGHAELKDAIVHGEIHATKGSFEGDVSAGKLVAMFNPGDVFLGEINSGRKTIEPAGNINWGTECFKSIGYGKIKVTISYYVVGNGTFSVSLFSNILQDPMSGKDHFYQEFSITDSISEDKTIEVEVEPGDILMYNVSCNWDQGGNFTTYQCGIRIFSDKENPLVTFLSGLGPWHIGE